MTQKFECEHCGKVSVEVWHDDDFEGALCNKCIATKDTWMDADGETIDHAKMQEAVSCYTQVLYCRAVAGTPITRDGIIAVVNQFNVVYEFSHTEWTLVVGILTERFIPTSV